MELVFGSEEWFTRLNEITDFPATFVFVMDTDKQIFSQKISSKAENTDNIKYKTIKNFDPRLAILDVLRINTDQAYYNEVKRLKKIWCGEETEKLEETK